MSWSQNAGGPLPETSSWTAREVGSLLSDQGWLLGSPSDEQLAWCLRAATLLGPHAADRGGLGRLLRLVFHYDAVSLLAEVDSHVTLSRYGARDVLRETGRMLLESPGLDSDRFKQLITSLRERLDLSAREVLMPLRLALAGQLGEGELDRVILLLDEAAALPWAVPVKGSRARMLEFYAALD